MPGLAYNPQGYEPDLHGKLDSKVKPDVFIEEAKNFDSGKFPPKTDYQEVRTYLEKGEGRLLGHYVYEMLYDIYPGIEDDLIEGSWDTHGHIYPDYVPRCINIIDYAIEASKVKMGGIIGKDHFFTNVGQAWAAQVWIDEMVKKGELEYATRVYGTHVLAWSFHPDQINLIRKYPNLGGIFLPTMSSRGDQCGPKNPLIDEKGNLVPELAECIRLCAEYKIPVFAGHRTWPEKLAVCQVGHDVGAHVLVTHGASFQFTKEQRDQCKELARLGAQLEMNAQHGTPTPIITAVDLNLMPEIIMDIGPEHIHINGDYGQPISYDPIEGMRVFLRILLHWGISKNDIKTMIQYNPEKLMYLRD